MNEKNDKRSGGISALAHPAEKSFFPKDLGDGRPGARWRPDYPCDFVVWAPRASLVEVRLRSASGERIVPMEPAERGYHRVILAGVRPGTPYTYLLHAPDGSTLERPDPASLWQPDGVHGPSRIVNTIREWDDDGWQGLALRDYVIYELHTGTFTAEGTFDAVIPRLAELRRLGITAVELMPIAQFPGSRNWGYDGVYPYAAQASYGGPDGFARLVNAAHAEGLAVILDVVYNHLGPEGNYLNNFGEYFTNRYKTPWGDALNFDGPGSDEVRRYFIENALFWVTGYHVDALRLDAVHGIFDFSAHHFVVELAEALHRRAQALGRQIVLIAESDLNDPKVIEPPPGGVGLDAQWSDDFHHAVHSLLTGERQGYYADFGAVRDLASAFKNGFIYTGQYSEFRRRRHGAPPLTSDGSRLVVFSQNHDQVGNRMMGERLAAMVPFEALKLAAAMVLLSPFLPLLFMGEEYGEKAPFFYFVSHSEANLIEAVRQGRREEFRAFEGEGELPWPDEEKTFWDSKLRWDLRNSGRYRVLLDFYHELLRWRRELPPLANLSTTELEASAFDEKRWLMVRRWEAAGRAALLLANFSDRENEVVLGLGSSGAPASRGGPGGPGAGGRALSLRPHSPEAIAKVPYVRVWRRLLDSAESHWGGPGSRLPLALDSAEPGGVVLAPFQFALFGSSEEAGQ